MMERIGVFGGTFNPVHLGHVRLAENYIKALGLQRLLVIPTRTPPHKAAPHLPDGQIRLRLCQLAFADIPQVQVSDMELRRSGKSFTVDTLRQLHQLYPQAELFLLVGSDMFLTFSQWKDWQEILKLATLCTAARNIGELDALNSCAQQLSQYGSVMVFDFPVLPLSSTQVRQELTAGHDCTSLVGEAVYREILKLGLYQKAGKTEMTREDYVEVIRPMLKPKRFEHSLNVARQAVKLAKLYGEDEEKAYVAGILHDICKNMSDKEQLQWMEKSGIIFDDNLLAQPPVWHGFAGAEYLRQVLRIEDEDIINAVRYHTIARAGMSRLEQIIYLADLTSEERNYPDLDRMSKVVLRSLREGMREALVFAVGNQAAKRLPLCMDTCMAYNEYLKD